MSVEVEGMYPVVVAMAPVRQIIIMMPVCGPVHAAPVMAIQRSHAFSVPEVVLIHLKAADSVPELATLQEHALPKL